MRPLLLVLVATWLAGVEPSPVIDWTAVPAAPGYAEATAWKPGFDGKALWPEIDGKEAFTKETWEPPEHLYTWLHPGESAEKGGRNAKHDPWEAKNWLDSATGKPASELKWGPGIDFLVPASASKYVIAWKLAGQEHNPREYRHLTVQAGGGWSTSGGKVFGNVWIKRGASHGNHGSLAFAGPKHTFFRNDNGDPRENNHADTGITQYVSFDKPGASTEFLGTLSTGDEFRVFSGTLIIGRDSRIMPGRNATPFIRPNATLALLDGAHFGKWVNQLVSIDLLCDGNLQGGLPERPLTRDAEVGISYQNTNGTTFYAPGAKAEKNNLDVCMTPLLVGETGVIRSYSVDRKRACLVLGWIGLDAKAWHCQGIGFTRSPKEEQERKIKACDALPKYVTAAFKPGAMVDGLRFSRFLKGGILLLDPKAREAWKDVAFADDNQAPPDQLFRTITKLSKSGTYE